MELFNKLFAEKILAFHEGTNKILRAMIKMPVLHKHMSESVFDKDNSKARMIMGIIGQIVRMFLEFMQKFIYVLLLIYVPYRLIASICPLIQLHQELTVIYMFTILSLICGSLSNNTLLQLGDRDYLMIRVLLISPYMNFLGRLIYKMVTEMIYFPIILCIFGVRPIHSIMLTIATICAKPIGEMISLFSFEHLRSVYERRNTFNGLIMALSVLFAYGMPLLRRRIDDGWLFVTHPMFTVILMAAGSLAMYYLWRYPYYRKIMRAAMFIKRED